ncbi:MAG: M23 family metallopeptidase [Candidatus Hydrogenedentota bacterium]|nr:MAG: M23 family metallopeptidase [Candidatus Hydrogenedentota bacterium]
MMPRSLKRPPDTCSLFSSASQPLHFRISSPLLVLSLMLLLSGCTGLFSNILHQDNPALFVRVDPLYHLPLPHTREYFLLVQGVGGEFSHTGNETYAFDWSMPVGTPIPAARDGVVVFVRNRPYDRMVPLEKRIANVVKVRHRDGTVGVYAHLDTTSIRIGTHVRVGDIIGHSGNTGYSTRPHLHFHVEKDGRSIPIAFVDVDDPLGIPRVGKLYQGSGTRTQ